MRKKDPRWGTFHEAKASKSWQTVELSQLERNWGGVTTKRREDSRLDSGAEKGCPWTTDFDGNAVYRVLTVSYQCYPTSWFLILGLWLCKMLIFGEAGWRAYGNSLYLLLLKPFKSLKWFQNEWLKNFNSKYATKGDDNILRLDKSLNFTGTFVYTQQMNTYKLCISLYLNFTSKEKWNIVSSTK